MIYVSDSLIFTDSRERQRGVESAQRGNVTFSALLCSTKKTVLARSTPFVPLGLALGLRTKGADYFAEQTGGEAIRVHKPEDYRKGLEDIMERISSRYTLGFELDADEPDDDKLHRLEVKVKATDKSGNPRKLEVLARRGYFLPKPLKPVAQKTVVTVRSPVTTDQVKRETDEQQIRQAVYDLHYSVMTGDVDGVKPNQPLPAHSTYVYFSSTSCSRDFQMAGMAKNLLRQERRRLTLPHSKLDGVQRQHQRRTDQRKGAREVSMQNHVYQ